MPIVAGAEVHAIRHVSFPELHRSADDQVIYVEVSGVRGRSQAERPRTDDQKLRVFATGQGSAPIPNALC